MTTRYAAKLAAKSPPQIPPASLHEITPRARTLPAVAVELYSLDRRTVWPGGEKVYLLEKGEKKSVPVSCQAGETICWGAWLNGDAGTFWGVGPDNHQACDDCCSICVAKTTATAAIGD